MNVVVVDVYGGHNCVKRKVCARAHLGRGRDHVSGTRIAHVSRVRNERLED